MDVLEGAIAVDKLNDDDFMAPVWRKLQALEKSCSLATFKPPRKIKVQTKGGPSFGCSFLRVVGFLSFLRVVGASPASAPGSSDHSTFFYLGVGATIIGTVIAATSLGVSIWGRRERGDGVRGVEVELERERGGRRVRSAEDVLGRERGDGVRSAEDELEREIGDSVRSDEVVLEMGSSFRSESA